MEWDDALVIRSVKSEKCEMCGNSYDPRGIREHLAEAHQIGQSSQGRRVKTEGNQGRVRVREHTRKRLWRQRK